MTKWRGVLATMVLLSAVITVVGVRPAPQPKEPHQALSQPSASPSSSSSPTATRDPQSYHSATAGFLVRLPRGWTAVDRSESFNRRSYRVLLIGNRGTDLPAAANATPLPGPVADWTQLATDRIVLELSILSGPGGPRPDSAESTFPLDWSSARAIPDGQGNVATALSLQFQHLLRPFTLIARIGTHAPPSDVAEIAGIVASLTPEPIPTSGEYRGWRVIGPLASRPMGSVEYFPAVAPSGYGFYAVRGAASVFAFIDHAYLFMGAMKPCPIRYESPSRTFVCDDTGERWSRVGRQLTAGGHFGLAYHLAFVKDGLVLVGSGSTNGGGISHEEAAEFADPIVPVAPGRSLTRTEILERYSRLTSTTPTTRSAAKLALADVAVRSQLIRGMVIPPQTRTVWVIAFAGEVRLPGSTTVHGRWTVFIADPVSGGPITAACCGDGDWPPGFDQLPDLAAN